MNVADLNFFKLQQATNIRSFESKDDDLNDFLFSKAKHYHKELLATTFIIENARKTFAYFSIFNDALKIQERSFATKSAFNRFIRRIVSHPKRHIKSYPAVKIGRLAVCRNEKGFGKLIIEYIINYAIDINKRCGCKFITVDAYTESVGFYEKMGFSYLTEEDTLKDTRQMYLDITPFIKT